MKNQQRKSFISSYFSSSEILPLDQSLTPKLLHTNELIHLVGLLDTMSSFSNHQLFKLYLLLFQLCTTSHKKEELIKLLTYYNFLETLQQLAKQKEPTPQKILLIHISEYLDSFKKEVCPFRQLKSLVDKYHLYRLLDYFKDFHHRNVLACIAIRDYLENEFENIRERIFEARWEQMENNDFQHFYKKYTMLCEIYKRISYIDSKHINFKYLQLGERKSRDEIEEKYRKMKKMTTLQLQGKFSVRKNLKMMTNVIKKMKKNNDISLYDNDT